MVGLSDDEKMKVGLMLGSFSKEIDFEEWKFPSGSDDPTWHFTKRRTNGSSNDQTRWFEIQMWPLNRMIRRNKHKASD